MEVPGRQLSRHLCFSSSCSPERPSNAHSHQQQRELLGVFLRVLWGPRTWVPSRQVRRSLVPNLRHLCSQQACLQSALRTKWLTPSWSFGFSLLWEESHGGILSEQPDYSDGAISCLLLLWVWTLACRGDQEDLVKGESVAVHTNAKNGPWI